MIRFRALQTVRGRLLAGLWWALVSLVPAEMVRLAMMSRGQHSVGYVLIVAALLAGVVSARVPVIGGDRER